METETQPFTERDIKNEILERTKQERQMLSEIGLIDEVEVTPFNNWPMRLPGGLYETRYLKELGTNYRQNDQAGASNLFKNQTLGEYIETINQTLIEVGGEELKKEMLRIRQLIDNPDPDKDFRVYSRQLEKVAEPLYIALRLKGYNHYDLTR